MITKTQIKTNFLSPPGIINLIFQNTREKNQFIHHAKGGTMNSLIDSFDMNALPYDAISKLNMDYIDPNEIFSELSVQDYLTFFSMLLGDNTDVYIDSIFDIITIYGKNSLLKTAINSLSVEDKIFVRTIISYMKKSRYIIIDYDYSMMDNVSFLIDFFNRFLVPKTSYCIFLKVQ